MNAFIQNHPLRQAAGFCAASSRQNPAERSWMAPPAAEVAAAAAAEEEEEEEV
jgi:hypothetical protein